MMVLVMLVPDNQELMVDSSIVLVSLDVTKKVEVDMWGSQNVYWVGLLVDLVFAMAKETIEDVEDNLQESIKPDNVSLEVVA
jgi:predicted branched-subunit amino acid permease